MSALRHPDLALTKARRSAMAFAASGDENSSSSIDRMKAEPRLCCWAKDGQVAVAGRPEPRPSFSMASARARMPRPEVFSRNGKSSSMTMTGKLEAHARLVDPALGRAGSKKLWADPRGRAVRPGCSNLAGQVFQIFGSVTPVWPQIFAAPVLVRGGAPRRTRRTASGPRPRWRRSWRAAAWCWKTPASRGPPTRARGRHVDDDAAAGIGGLAQAHGEHAARDAEVFDRAGQREGVRRDDAHVAGEIHEVARSSKFFGSTMVELMLVKILNSLATRTS